MLSFRCLGRTAVPTQELLNALLPGCTSGAELAQLGGTRLLLASARRAFAAPADGTNQPAGSTESSQPQEAVAEAPTPATRGSLEEEINAIANRELRYNAAFRTEDLLAGELGLDAVHRRQQQLELAKALAAHRLAMQEQAQGQYAGLLPSEALKKSMGGK